MSKHWAFGALVTMVGCASLGGRPPTGAVGELGDDEKAAIAAIGGKVNAVVAWSSSRFGNHDIFAMRADGKGLERLTQSEHVDWFPRFSPRGDRILFIRSKKGWVSERDANRHTKWDLYTMKLDGSDVKPVAQDASWGTWVGDNSILFSRATKVFRKNLQNGKEALLVDSEQQDALGGAYLQQPQLSPDGKHLAITLRGSKRETGVWSMATRTWVATGLGCQINWKPNAKEIYWVNPSGNGGSEVFSMKMAGGKPAREYDYEQMRFIDIPGRRSHEYFPQLSVDGRWLVWAATQRGHDHDIADYEIYIWQVGAPAEQATRLSFHSGNDRWPDILLLGNR